VSQKRGFDIKCNECGRKATVPFKPKADKPVFCNACFSKRVQNRQITSKLNFSFNTKNAWARRGNEFTGRREKEVGSIFK
jgi:CxxC-x17-CxxC domain-containing protein